MGGRSEERPSWKKSCVAAGGPSSLGQCRKKKRKRMKEGGNGWMANFAKIRKQGNCTGLEKVTR